MPPNRFIYRRILIYSLNFYWELVQSTIIRGMAIDCFTVASSAAVTMVSNYCGIVTFDELRYEIPAGKLSPTIIGINASNLICWFKDRHEEGIDLVSWFFAICLQWASLAFYCTNCFRPQTARIYEVLTIVLCWWTGDVPPRNRSPVVAVVKKNSCNCCWWCLEAMISLNVKNGVVVSKWVAVLLLLMNVMTR